MKPLKETKGGNEEVVSLSWDIFCKVPERGWTRGTGKIFALLTKKIIYSVRKTDFVRFLYKVKEILESEEEHSWRKNSQN